MYSMITKGSFRLSPSFFPLYASSGVLLDKLWVVLPLPPGLRSVSNTGVLGPRCLNLVTSPLLPGRCCRPLGSALKYSPILPALQWRARMVAQGRVRARARARWDLQSGVRHGACTSLDCLYLSGFHVSSCLLSSCCTYGVFARRHRLGSLPAECSHPFWRVKSKSES